MIRKLIFQRSGQSAWAWLFAWLLLGVAPLPAALTDGLVAHYRFDEVTGTTAADSVRAASGNATLNNFGSGQWVAGRAGGALEFDGTNDWVAAPIATASGLATITVAGWVWADSRPVWASIVKNWGGNIAGQFHFGLQGAGGNLSNYLTNGTSIADAAQFPLGQWVHVAFTCDGATHRLYRDGVQVASGASSTGLTQANGTMTFGAKTNNAGTAPDGGSPGFWDGKLDDFGIWTRALAASEIAMIRNAGLAGMNLAQAGVPAIASFTASPAPIAGGGSTTLTWSVQNATTLTLNGGPFVNQNVNSQSSIVASNLTSTTTFTLTATNAAGNATAQRIVGVGVSVSGPWLNEIVAENHTGDSDEDGDREDWIELRNPNAFDVDLTGWFLTDHPGNLNKWAFPAGSLLPAGGFLRVWASEKNRAVSGRPLHTNFKLSADGEYLALVKPDGTTIADALTFPDQTPDLAYGRTGAPEALRYLATPTPLVVNSTPAGPFLAQLTENLASQPAAGSPVTITVRAVANSAPVTGVTLRYRAMFGAESAVAMLDNGVSPDAVAGDGAFSALIPAGTAAPGQMLRWRVTATDSSALTARLPIFASSMASPEYHGTVVANPSVTSQLPIIERFVADTVAVDTLTGTRCATFFAGEFQDNVAIRIRGLTSLGFPKKSHKIEFNRGHDFLVRAGQARVDEIDLNSTYSDKSYVRAVLASEHARASGTACIEQFLTHQRQNGTFYSVTIFTEQPDGDFLERNGLDRDGALYKAPNNNTLDSPAGLEKKTRRNEGNTDVTAFIAGIQQTDAALETFLFDQVDLAAQVNLMANIVITQDIDRADKNFFLYRDTEGSREWRMLPWDMDLTFGPNALNTDTIVASQNSPATPLCPSHPFIGTRPFLLSSGKYNRFLEAMIANPRGKQMLLRRIRSLIDAHLATGDFSTRMDALLTQAAPDAELDNATWGANAHFPGTTYTMQQACARIKSEYFAPRLSYLNLTHAAPASAGDTPSVGIPSAHPPAPAVNIGAIERSPASGNQDEEYVTLTNPNGFAVDLSGWKVEGAVALTIPAGTVLLSGESCYLSPRRDAFRARAASPKGGENHFVVGNYAGHLSNFAETLVLKNAAGTVIASLDLPAMPSDPQLHLRITELNYHPPGNGLAEFIELQNTSATVTLDLTGVHFSDGVEFRFTDGTLLAPGERIHVVRDTAAFIAAFNAAPRVAGEFFNSTNLSDGGEHIALDDASGSTIQDFTYDDNAPWPASADGAGPSLHFIVGSSGAPGVSEAVRWFALAPNPGIVPSDADADGRSNYQEWLAGSDAGSAASYFSLSQLIRNGDGTISGTFFGVAGKTYRVMISPDLVTWTPLGNVITATTTGSQTFTDVSPGTPQRFYKIITPSP